MRIKFRPGPSAKNTSIDRRFAGLGKVTNKTALRKYVRVTTQLINGGQCVEAIDAFERLRKTPIRGKGKALNTIRKRFARKCLRTK